MMIKEQAKSEIAKAIERIMKPHVGICNAILGRDLFRMVAKEFPDMRDVRRKVCETIEPGGELCGHIVSIGHGYFIPLNDTEAAKAAAYLMSYISALSKRRKAIQEQHPSILQMDLPMEGAGT